MSINENPQKEDGYVAIANKIMDKLSQLYLAPNEWRILMFVLRKTWGWNKKEDKISLSQFQEGTNISRPNVVDAIKSLVAKGILVVNKKGFINVYSFNKFYTKWTSSHTTTSSQGDTRVVAKGIPKLVAKGIPTKDNKPSIQKTYIPVSQKPEGKARKKRETKCPLVVKGIENGHKHCVALLEDLAKQKGMKGWLNMPKQIGSLHKMIRFGISSEQIRETAKELDEDKYWWDKWDLATIASRIEKKGKEVIVHATK